MNREELKLKLVEVFSKTYEKTTIDEKFVAAYKSLFWQTMIEAVDSASRASNQHFQIDQWFVSVYKLPIPPNSDINNERSRIYDAMYPLIPIWLNEMGIKYETGFDVSGKERYQITISELRKFSNVEILGTLK